MQRAGAIVDVVVVANRVHQSFDIMEKRDLVVNSSRTAPTHRRVWLLVDLGTGIAMWVSCTTTSTIILALQAQPSSNGILRGWQKVSSVPLSAELN
jgi:hypothetical protein